MKLRPAEIRRGQQRARGTYLTPDGAARFIAEIAIKGAHDTILDPALGAGVFVEASIARLSSLGAADAAGQTYGVDIDADAIKATRMHAPAVPSENLREADFLGLDPAYLPKVDVVLGNPPWIGHHALGGRIAATAENVSHDGFKPSGRSGYWVYFLAHAMRFLAPGGRIAMLLPWAVVQAQYAESLRRHLVGRFRRVQLHAVEQRLFKDTDERAAVLYAEGFGEGPGTLTIARVKSLTEANGTDGQVDVGFQLNMRSSIAFGEIATIKIGIVTGANSFFLLSHSAARTHNIPAPFLKACLTRRRQIRGLTVTRSDIRRLAHNDDPIYLLSVPSSVANRAVRKYLEFGEAQGVDRHYKCAVRDSWFQVEDVAPPDAVMNYLGSEGPILAMNRAGVRATNSFYVVNWLDREVDPVSVAAALISTVGSLASEKRGRVLGGGALKLEPRDVKALRIPAFRLRAAIGEQVERAVRARDLRQARELVDRQLIADGILSKEDVATASRELSGLRQGRQDIR